MSNIIDVLIIIDAARILQDHAAQSSKPQSSSSNQSGTGSSGNATPLLNGGRSYVFLVAPWSNAAQTGSSDSQEGGYELQTTVKVGDVVRYRMLNLPLRRDYQGFIEQIDVAIGQQCLTAPSLQQRASNSTTLDTSVSTLDQVMPIPITDSCWESTMTQTGMAAMNLKFSIYDAKAALQGRFSFSPWHTVMA